MDQSKFLQTPLKNTGFVNMAQRVATPLVQVVIKESRDGEDATSQASPIRTTEEASIPDCEGNSFAIPSVLMDPKNLPPRAPAGAGPGQKTLAGGAPTQSASNTTAQVQAGIKSRNPPPYSDSQGNERTFHSSLGLTTRKFMDMVQSSESGSVDMNDCAVILGVRKRRIYDITGVLEGIGLIEKRGKNTVAWKGSEGLLGETIDSRSKERMEQLRSEITAIQEEEAQLDIWTHQLQKKSISGRPVPTRDIVKAVLYPDGRKEPGPREKLLDEEGKPSRGLMIIQAEYGGVACIPPGAAGAPERQLYVGKREGARKYGITLKNDDDRDACPGTGEGCAKKRRVFPLSKRVKGTRAPRSKGKISVYVVPTYFDKDKQKVLTTGAQLVKDESYVLSLEVEAAVTGVMRLSADATCSVDSSSETIGTTSRPVEESPAAQADYNKVTTEFHPRGTWDANCGPSDLFETESMIV